MAFQPQINTSDEDESAFDNEVLKERSCAPSGIYKIEVNKSFDSKRGREIWPVVELVSMDKKLFSIK